MNKDGDNSAQPKAPRCQRQQNAQQQLQKKSIHNPSIIQPKDAQGGSKNKPSGTTGTLATRRVSEKEKKPGKYNRLGKAELAAAECQKNQSTQRKLSDASNASEDLSKDSGCLSGKISSSDSSSEISDCQSEGNKVSLDTQSSDTNLSGSDGKALESSSGDRPTFTSVTDMRREGNPSARTWQDNYTAGDGYNSPGFCGDSLASFPSLDVSVAGYSDLTGELLGETTDDLVREVDDLRSENEYLKDEMEELRCEMLEMRDMFMEEEVYQLQELRLQLDQANKLCRILQYRLRKAERRSIRVAQTGQVDGELVRTLEHDIKVAKSISVRLHNELETVQQKNSQLEWENERLRERTQDLEVSKQVLQSEMEKARESSLKRRSVRSPTSKPEKKLYSQDDSADLRCQLHFAKEESALMCKKLTKLALDSDNMHEELTRYRSVYGDIDTACSSESAANSPYAREAEVKVHLRLVEEEATLLSRRIVELEVENRGLRAEMSDLRERAGEEDEEPQEGVREHLALAPQVRDSDEGEQSLGRGYVHFEDGEMSEAEGRRVLECSRVQMRFQLQDNNQSQAERIQCSQSQIAREGPVGGERDPLDIQESDSDKEGGRAIDGLSSKGHEALLALRNHACLVSSAIQLLTTPVKNGHCPPTLSPYPPRSEADPQGKSHSKGLDPLLQGHLYGALELLQTMLLAFVGRTESLMTSEGESSFQGVKGGWDTDNMASLSGACALNDKDIQNILESTVKLDTIEDPHKAQVNEKAKQAKEDLGPPSQRNHLHSCRDPIERLTWQILWVLHRRCLRERSAGLEGKEVRETSMHVLQGLLLELGSELQKEGLIHWETKGTQSEMTEAPVNTIIEEGRSLECKWTYSKETKHRLLKFGSNQKNRCYLSHEAAQLGQGDPSKTWDHPIMPLSFPGLDLEQMTMERSHTAPERTSLCIYYSPPSARRVQLAHLKKSSTIVRNSPTAISPCCRSSSSISPLCLRLSANLSDDMKEMTASIRQAVRHSSSLERRKGSVGEGWAVDVASSGTQTQTQQPQMVNVGLQTDGLHIVGAAVSASPSRVLSSSLVSTRTHHISSLERTPGRADRPKSSSTSPKMYRRSSASAPSSLSSFTSSATSSNSFSSSSSSTASTERALLNLSQRGPARSTWVRPSNARTGPALNHSTLSGDVGNTGRNTKPPSKPAAANRYGLVTEFLRRVSGRTDKPASGTVQKGKSGLKNLERPPSTRPLAAPLHRNDSITRIVNQRFMKQREEAGRVQREEKGQSPNQVVKGPISRDQSLTTITSESGNYECSSKTLTFCFARSTQRPASNQVKLRRHGYSPAVAGLGEPDCE